MHEMDTIGTGLSEYIADRFSKRSVTAVTEFKTMTGWPRRRTHMTSPTDGVHSMYMAQWR